MVSLKKLAMLGMLASLPMFGCAAETAAQEESPDPAVARG